MSENTFSLPELLPPEAAPIVEAAKFDLVTLHAPVSVAYDRFHRRLDEKGIEPPSLRSFRRWAATIRSRKGLKERTDPVVLKLSELTETRGISLDEGFNHELLTFLMSILAPETKDAAAQYMVGHLLTAFYDELAEALHSPPETLNPFEGVAADAQKRFQEIVNDFLGLPKGSDPEALRGTSVRIPLKKRAR
jgi:hypothetical protein